MKKSNKIRFFLNFSFIKILEDRLELLKIKKLVLHFFFAK